MVKVVVVVAVPV
jgi:hypothetical protein